MKKSIFLFICIITAQIAVGQGVGIGTTSPAASAKLEVSSTTQGMLVPRMTTAQRTAISSPASGLLVFDMTTQSFWFRGSVWVELVDSVNNEVHRSGPNMVHTGLTDNVGIGVMTPANKLDINLGAARTGTHSTNRPLYVTGTIGPNDNGMEFMHSNGAQGIGIGYNTLYAAGSNPSQDLGLAAKGTSGNILLSTNGNERMRIKGDGRIGIGTSDPYYPLHVLAPDGFGIVHQNGGCFLATYISNNIANFATFNAFPLHFKSDNSPNQLVLIPSGNVGVGLNNPLQKLHVGGNFAVDNFVGIGNTNPQVPLQFANDFRNRKIVLLTPEAVNDDHQYYGFGVNNLELRYQTMLDHVFYKGTGPTSSTEMMRIKYNGRVGIGISYPNAMLEVARGTADNGSLQVNGTLHSSHFNYYTEEDTYIRGGKAGSKVIINELADLGNVGIGTANPLQKLHVGGKLVTDNYIGIENSDPHAPLQFNNDTENRKIVLWEGIPNDDHQFYGFGVNGSILRYQVSNVGDNHIFYAGTVSGSNELMRIKGGGNVDIAGSLEIGWAREFGPTTTLFPGTSGTSTCNCPPGTVIISGGYETSPDDDLRVTDDWPATSTSWTVTGYNSSQFVSILLTTWAVCARLAN